mmetsp:Transcript_16412/g.24312  ORF Transcript_16412/g.24312 Transcript_16412/m.24312 type:complete len:83 (-) Transcript_16412:121-369(-)
MRPIARPDHSPEIMHIKAPNQVAVVFAEHSTPGIEMQKTDGRNMSEMRKITGVRNNVVRMSCILSTCSTSVSLRTGLKSVAT